MALPFGLKTGLTAKTSVTFDSGDKQETVEFGARCLAHAIVYQMNGKPVKTAEVPEAVKEQLIGTMLAGAGAGVEAELEAPTETPNPMGVVDKATTYDPAVLDSAVVPILEEGKGTQIMVHSTPTGNNEFAEIAKAADAENEALRVAQEIEAQVNQAPESPFGVSPLATAPLEDSLGFDDVQAPVIDYEELLADAEARSVDNANLKVLVDALYRRFNVYLPFVNQPPRRSDISPINGMVMNALTYGQAVQGFKTAQRAGTSWNPVEIRAQLNSSRASSSVVEEMPRLPEEAVQDVQPYGQPVEGMPENLHGEPAEPAMPEMPLEYRKFASPHKSAQQFERGNERDGLDPDEVYAEPPINAQTAIIRPFQVNRRSMAKLEEIDRQRRASIPQNISFNDLG